MVSSACLRLLIFLPAILIPACASSSPAFLMMYSAYTLNKEGDNIQPGCTPFPISNQSVVPCPVLTNCAYWHFYFKCPCCSVAQSCPTLWDPMDYSTPGFPVLHHLPDLAQTHVCWVSDATQPSHPLSSPSPPAPNLSQHQDLFSESVPRIRWPKYWSFSFSPSSEHSGLISFRMDWLDLLPVQGSLTSLLQNHSSKASILTVLSFLYSPTLTSIHDYWKNHSFD